MIESKDAIKKELKHMKHYVWLGIMDYLNDCRHDRVYDIITGDYCQWVCDDIGDKKFKFVNSGHWKEGNVWHYIQQRKIAYAKKKLASEFYENPRRKRWWILTRH